MLSAQEKSLLPPTGVLHLLVQAISPGFCDGDINETDYALRKLRDSRGQATPVCTWGDTCKNSNEKKTLKIKPKNQQKLFLRNTIALKGFWKVWGNWCQSSSYWVRIPRSDLQNQCEGKDIDLVLVIISHPCLLPHEPFCQLPQPCRVTCNSISSAQSSLSGCKTSCAWPWLSATCTRPLHISSQVLQYSERSVIICQMFIFT